MKGATHVGLGCAAVMLVGAACTKPNPVYGLESGTSDGNETVSSTSSGPGLTSTESGPSSTTTTTTSSQGTTDVIGGTGSTGSTGGTGGTGRADELPACGDLDACTVAYYRFEDLSVATVHDANRDLNPGSWLGGMAPVPVQGPSDCGGQGFRGTSGITGVIPPSTDFDVAVGAVDFWVVPPDPNATNESIVSRDADGQGPGHLTVWVGRAVTAAGVQEGHLGVRLQNETQSAMRCSEEPLTLEQWTHVGINFGGGVFELYVDGELQMLDGSMGLTAVFSACDLEIDASMVGNPNPWVIGAANYDSTPGTTDDLRFPFTGDIDEVRISQCHRPFARL